MFSSNQQLDYNWVDGDNWAGMMIVLDKYHRQNSSYLTWIHIDTDTWNLYDLFYNGVKTVNKNSADILYWNISKAALGWFIFMILKWIQTVLCQLDSMSQTITHL